MGIKQKDAVINEVHSVLGSSFDPSVPAREQLNEAQLKTIKNNIVAGIVDGTIDFKKEYSSVDEVSRYVSGMVSNYLRKAQELNGGIHYKPQSEGKGSRDAQISELTKLLKTYSEGTEEYKSIVSAIHDRRSELASQREFAAKEKRKTKELNSINMEALPDNLKELANTLIGGFSAQ